MVDILGSIKGPRYISAFGTDMPALREVLSGGVAIPRDDSRIKLFCLLSDVGSSRNSLSFPFPPFIALISVFCWPGVSRNSGNKQTGSWLADRVGGQAPAGTAGVTHTPEELGNSLTFGCF